MFTHSNKQILDKQDPKMAMTFHGTKDPQQRLSENLKSLGQVKRSPDQEKLKKLYINYQKLPNPVFMSF